MKNDGRESKTARKMAQVGWPSFDFSLGLSSLRNQTETFATLRRLVELRLLKYFISPTPYSFFLIAFFQTIS